MSARRCLPLVLGLALLTAGHQAPGAHSAPHPTTVTVAAAAAADQPAGATTAGAQASSAVATPAGNVPTGSSGYPRGVDHLRGRAPGADGSRAPPARRG